MRLKASVRPVAVNRFRLVLLSLGILAGSALRASAADGFAELVSPVLKRHCFECHSGKNPDTDLNLSTLPADFGQHGQAWNLVIEHLRDGSMPPKGKPAVPAADRKRVIDWLTTSLTEHAAKQPATNGATGRSLLRRLNRIEYQNTVNDLLGIQVELAELLPEDGSAHGFDNVDLGLDLSSTLLERYLEAADVALAAALTRRKPIKETPPRRIDVADAAREHKKKNPTGQNLYGPARIESDHIEVLNDVPNPRVLLERPLDPGLYRYRMSISSNAMDKDNQVAMRVYAGAIGQSGRIELVGIYPLTSQPQTIEFTARIGKGDRIGIAASGVSSQYNLPDSYRGPGLCIYWTEVHGPLNEPQHSLEKIYGDIPRENAAEQVRALVTRFASRAYRRPVKPAEIEPYLKLIQGKLAQPKLPGDKTLVADRFEDALRVGLKAILCSPDFLYLPVRTSGAKGVAKATQLDDFELAARLSYFLWSTMPDESLLSLAADKQLSNPAQLRTQVERMLASPKARAFTENFTGQWLNLRNIKATDPDQLLYPEFDPLLEYSMLRETRLFFDEILKNDRSTLEFVHSDWSMLNGRLADHYGIPGVKGQGFRKVTLPADSHRGGVMTQASVLKVSANGTTTSPVLRGVFVLDRIQGRPVPPPPNDIPAIEPDIRGAITIREQLEKHRNQTACAGCHARIDPPGFALESFDVIGGWRERYRVTPSAKFRQGKSSKGKYADGPPVLSAYELTDGKKFENIDGFKQLLLADPDQIVRNLAQRLLVYSTGHGIELSDRAAVDKIVLAAKAKNNGFRTLVHEVVQSTTFRHK